jgi:hypothetical protein
MICGSGDPERTYLDVGVFFDYEGSMYICILCGTQIGETLGLFTPEEIRIQTEAIANLQRSVDSMEEELGYARPIIAGIRRMLSSDPVSGMDSVSDSAVVDVVPEGQSGSGVSVPDAIPGIAADGESTAKESTPKPDPAGISFS